MEGLAQLAGLESVTGGAAGGSGPQGPLVARRLARVFWSTEEEKGWLATSAAAVTAAVRIVSAMPKRVVTGLGPDGSSGSEESSGIGACRAVA